MSRVKVLMLSVLAVFAVGAIASASASALVWEECLNENTGTGTKYSDAHHCEVASGTGTWEWMPITKTLNVTSEGGKQELKLATSPEIIITCQKVLDEGNIKPEGQDEITRLLYHECSINIASCPIVKSQGEPHGVTNMISVTKLKSHLITTGGGLTEDVIEPSTGTLFVTLEIGKLEKENGEAEKACGVLEAKDKVEGTANAMVEGSKLIALGVGTLKTKGIESKYFGIDENKLASGNLARAR